MKILWVTAQFPCLRSGAQVRQFHLLRHLSRRHHIRILSLLADSEVAEVAVLRGHGIDVIAIPYTPSEINRKWANRIRSWLQLFNDPRPNFMHTYPCQALAKQLVDKLKESEPDVVHLDQLFVAPLGRLIDGVPVVLSENNVESRNFERQSRYAPTLTRRIAGWIETKKLRLWERSMLQQCDACVAVSEADAAELHFLDPKIEAFVVPNGVDSANFTPPGTPNPHREGLLFFGALDYAPNVDALLYFAAEIFPKVQKEHPDVKLRIIGRNAPDSIIALNQLGGVEYIGFVDDVRPYLWQATVSVVPLRSGGGTRLKILEALAADCPVVSTTIGAEGLDLVHERDLLIADNPADFAAAIGRVIEDTRLQVTLASEGRKTVAEKYDWGSISLQLEAVYTSIAG
jgi:glycosyltransferase involved in cell wall biosynthesis